MQFAKGVIREGFEINGPTEDPVILAIYEKLVGKEDLEWTRVHLSADQVTRMNNFFELSEGPYFKVQKHGNYNDYNGPQVTDDLESSKQKDKAEGKAFLAPIKGMKLS